VFNATMLDRPVVSAVDTVRDGLQQHPAQARLTQQERSLLRTTRAVVYAEASLTAERIPAIAIRAIPRYRK
jgi:hypothetical protein